MTRVEFKRKSRKDPSSQLFVQGDNTVIIGRNYALQNEIDETKKITQARACFIGCRTCGKCSNSQRDATVPMSYDENSRKWIDCRGCEPYSFHDCQNGVMRNAYQDAEPFTAEQQKILKETGGKPLI